MSSAIVDANFDAFIGCDAPKSRRAAPIALCRRLQENREPNEKGQDNARPLKHQL